MPSPPLFLSYSYIMQELLLLYMTPDFIFIPASTPDHSYTRFFF